MSNILTYNYNFNSMFEKKSLTLANYSELSKMQNSCFFSGKLENSFFVSRCLITLSNIVKSSFNLSPFQMALLKDPIVTVGAEKIRFEGFSHCAGVYARVDILEGGHEGVFLESGTTNVDFNQSMISALGAVTRTSEMKLSVGREEVIVTTQTEKVIERKIPLPDKWVKGLTTVQHYMSESNHYFTLNKLQAKQLFKSIPKGEIKSDYYLIKRGNRLIFSPMKNSTAIVVGGIHRLQLLSPLLPMIESLKIYAHKEMQSVTFGLYFKELMFSFSLSRSHWRGFSGEGVLLEELLEEIPEALLHRVNNYSYVNETFDANMLLRDSNIKVGEVENLNAKLSAMGLLGYELESENYFYRKLPFKPSRILTLNPRLKGVQKLLEEKKVNITKRKGKEIEAMVEGSGVTHFVVLNEKVKCTCVWFSSHQGERGECKHILAVKKMLKDLENDR